MKKMFFVIVLLALSVSAVARMNDTSFADWRTVYHERQVTAEPVQPVVVAETPVAHVVAEQVEQTPCPVFTGKECAKSQRVSADQ